MAKRKGRGEGTIYELPDGRWRAELNLGYSNGRRRRAVRYASTQAAARRSLTALVRDRDRGLPVVTERQTLGQFLDAWLRDTVTPRVRPSTYMSYAMHVRLNLKPALGHLRLDRPGVQHVNAMMRDLTARGLSPRSVQYARNVLRTALNDAVRWELLARNVAALATPPRQTRRQIRPLTAVEAQHLLETSRMARSRQDGLLWLALGTGARLGELLDLTWDDLDPDPDAEGWGKVYIHYALQRVDGKLRRVDLKTERSRRTLGLPPSLVEAMREHRDRQREDRMLAGSRWQQTPFVFTNTVGRPLEHSRVWRDFRRLLDRAGLPHVRFHDLRHTAASFMHAQGVPARVAMEQLGHSSVAVTLDVYTHVGSAAQRDAAAALMGVPDRVPSDAVPAESS